LYRITISDGEHTCRAILDASAVQLRSNLEGLIEGLPAKFSFIKVVQYLHTSQQSHRSPSRSRKIVLLEIEAVRCPTFLVGTPFSYDIVSRAVEIKHEVELIFDPTDEKMTVGHMRKMVSSRLGLVFQGRGAKSFFKAILAEVSCTSA
jgi:hypothetical protein